MKSQERHAKREKDHVKPDGLTLDYEKNLVKIATRGGNNEYQSKIVLYIIPLSYPPEPVLGNLLHYRF